MALSLRTSKQVLARLLHYLHFKHVSWISIRHCASAPVICLDTLPNWLHLQYPFLGLFSPEFWISPHTPKKPTAKWLIPMILAGLGSFTPRFWTSKMPGTETCHFWVFRGMVSWAIPSTLGYFFLGIFWSGISANDADGLGILLYNLFSSHWRIIYLSFQPSKKTNAQTIWKKSLNQAETNPCHVVFGEFFLVVERQWKAGHEVTK